VSKVIDCFVFTPPHPCSYDQEMKESKKKGTLPEGIVFITTKHGSRIPLHIVKHKRAKCTVLYSHGNSEDLGPMISNKYLSEWFRGNYISYDYTGYGYSEGGEHTEQHVYNDIEAVYEYLINEGGISPDELILYGRSLGSGPTVHLASTKPHGIAGMVLESALLSIVRTQCRCVSETWESDIFCNIDKISKIEAPTLVIHGTRDCVVPHYHGRHLQENIKNSVEPLWLPRGHNDLWDGDEAHCRPIFARINKFISFALRERRKQLLHKTVYPARAKKQQHNTDKKISLASNKTNSKRPIVVDLDDIELAPLNEDNHLSANANKQMRLTPNSQHKRQHQQHHPVTTQPHSIEAKSMGMAAVYKLTDNNKNATAASASKNSNNAGLPRTSNSTHGAAQSLLGRSVMRVASESNDATSHPAIAPQNSAVGYSQEDNVHSAVRGGGHAQRRSEEAMASVVETPKE